MYWVIGCDRKLPRNDISKKIAETVATQRSGQFSDTRSLRVVAKELPSLKELVAESGSGSLLPRKDAKPERTQSREIGEVLFRWKEANVPRASDEHRLDWYSPRFVSRITNENEGKSVAAYPRFIIVSPCFQFSAALFQRQRAKIT
ncbi:hypothetical protein K0M31_014957 [Melipona bicolor]|uniref:Uncharacterized protein n=1 Tax=Melipona bicolor TaxID=60889 RepID=A0AA40FGL4_9HYME|nr:hypothetical protein K0M31_014957 [Melipona bicolor]